MKPLSHLSEKALYSKSKFAWGIYMAMKHSGDNRDFVKALREATPEDVQVMIRAAYEADK